MGCGGSGKSTFARVLAQRTGLPLIHLDQEYWQPGWVERYSEDGWSDRVSELASGERWVIDGNYSKTLDVRLPRATAVIWLDLPRAVCISSALLRVVRHYGRVRVDSAPGCPERWDWYFIQYLWNWFSTSRPGVIRRLGLPKYAPVVARFRTRRTAWDWLARVPAQGGASLPALNTAQLE